MLADKGKAAEARELITAFVQKKCDEAIAKGKKMLEILNSLPVINLDNASLE